MGYSCVDALNASLAGADKTVSDLDLIECNQFPYLPAYPAKLAAKLGKIPLVITWHEVWGRYWRSYLGAAGALGQVVEKQVAALADLVVAVSEHTKQDLVSLGVAEDKIVVVPNGVDLESIRGVEPAGKGFDVVFAGRLIADKNVDVLLAALKHLPEDTSCCVVGEGPDKERLTALASELGVDKQVTFGGFLGEAELIAMFKSSKVFVLPSSREGFGIVVLEAQACGLPPVVVEHPASAASELVSDGKTGLLCELAAEDVAAKIGRLLGDETLREKIAKAAAEHASDFSWDDVAKQLEKRYAELLC